MFLHICEIECLRHKVPYVKRASGSFLDSREVLDILAYLRVAAGFDPEGKHMLRCIKAPFKYIGKRDLEAAASSHMVTGRGVLTALLDQARLSIKQRRSLHEMSEILRGTQDNIRRGMPPGEVVTAVIEDTRYLDYLRENRSDVAADSTKLGILMELEWLASLFEDTTAFLSYVDQLHESLRVQRKSLKKKDDDLGDYLVLTTIHRSKALEWDHVFIGDVVAGRFPWNLGHSFGEELRLMYVAVTRARKTVHLSCSKAEGDEESSLLQRVKTATKAVTGTCYDTGIQESEAASQLRSPE